MMKVGLSFINDVHDVSQTREKGRLVRLIWHAEIMTYLFRDLLIPC